MIGKCDICNIWKIQHGAVVWRVCTGCLWYIRRVISTAVAAIIYSLWEPQNCNQSFMPSIKVWLSTSIQLWDWIEMYSNIHFKITTLHYTTTTINIFQQSFLFLCHFSQTFYFTNANLPFHNWLCVPNRLILNQSVPACQIHQYSAVTLHIDFT